MEKVETKAQVQGNVNAETKTVEALAAKKQAKAEAAKRFAEHQKERKQQLKVAAEKLQKYIDDKKIKDMPKEVTDAITAILSAGTSTGTGSFFNKVFGETPKVGDKVTLMDFMKNTLKGKSEFDAYVKKWAEKGIVVEYKAAANMFESTYTITKLA